MQRGYTTSVQGETTGAVEFQSLCDLFDRVFLTITHVKKMPDGRRVGGPADGSAQSGGAQCKKGLHSDVQAFFGEPYSLVGSASFELATPAV
jgi:hypothetical protein